MMEPQRDQPPREVAELGDVSELVAAREYACAIGSGGRVSCWHFGADGRAGKPAVILGGGAIHVELGFGRADQLATSRTMLDGPEPGGEYGCAIMADRTVQCWGTNLYGELGDDSLDRSDDPIGVAL